MAAVALSMDFVMMLTELAMRPSPKDSIVKQIYESSAHPSELFSWYLIHSKTRWTEAIGSGIT